jgi:mono/diheme cytochrome c family protein
MGALKSPVKQGGRRLSERAWTILLGLLVLVVTVVSYLWHNPSTLPWAPADAAPQLSPAMVPLVTGEEPIAQLFTRAGCVVCHMIPGIPAAEGRVGPKLVLGINGSKRLADPNYHGEAKTPRDYIYESILAPGAYVVPGYADHVMPRWYGQKLSAAAMDKIAAYLESLSE